MTRRANFTHEEWELLGNAPLAACAAVAIADPGGGTSEARAIINGWRAAGALFADSELIESIVAGLDPERREEEERAHGIRPAARLIPPTFEQIRDEALDLCMAAVQLLVAKATVDEVEDYKEFVLYMTEEVANASNEGGLRNLGGDRISHHEHEVINDIADALGVDDEPADT